MKRKISIILISVLIVTLFCSCVKKQEKTTDNSTLSEIIENSSSTKVTITEIDTEGMDLAFTDNDTETALKNTVTKELSGNNINITKSGSFKVGGKLTQITVNVADTEKVHLILENVEICSENGPAIYVEQADKIFITVPEGTSSSLEDSAEYDDDFENADGVIFSRADITINGAGTLNITGNYKCGIVSKDDLNICDTEINITSQGTAIEGKDCVKLGNTNIDIESQTDGIKSTNSEVSTKGFVYISSGKFNIVSQNDAIQAETALFIEDGSFNIVSGGGAEISSSNNDSGWGNWGHGMHGYTESDSSQTESSNSAKALKAGFLMDISGGEFYIDSSDDSIHSNGDLEIDNGNFKLNSGDDGIHADDEMIINGGNIQISKSYEGIEATVITVNGGEISLTASDDGFNSAGGNDSSAMMGRPGQNPFESDSSSNIYINEGYIVIDASGDGIDSNGNIYINGGVILVSGPENSGNGSLDYGGTAVIDNGTIILTGSSGMAQGFSSSSKQYSFTYTLNSYQTADTYVSLCEGNKVILSFKATKKYNHIVISSPLLQKSTEYTLNIGGTVTETDQNGYTSNGKITNADSTYSIELSSVNTSFGSQSGGFGGGKRPF